MQSTLLADEGATKGAAATRSVSLFAILLRPVAVPITDDGLGMVELIWEDAGVLRRMSGVVTAEELDTTAVALQADERVDRLRYIIHDFSAATEITLLQDDIEFMAVRASVALLRNPGVRIAFVGDHPVVHALIDAFNSQGVSPHQCHRFDAIEEARRFTAEPDG